MQRIRLIPSIVVLVLATLTFASSAQAEAKVKGAKLYTFHFFPFQPNDGVEEERQMDVCAKTKTWGFGNCSSGSYETIHEGKVHRTFFFHSGEPQTFMDAEKIKTGWDNGVDIVGGAFKGAWEAAKQPR
jgi:hypothetical protein